VKDAEYFNSLGLHEIRDPVVLIEENPNVTLRTCEALAHLGVVHERLGTFVDPPHCSRSCVRIVLRDVLEDVFEPTQRFLGPD
jgi:hypothetical protein